LGGEAVVTQGSAVQPSATQASAKRPVDGAHGFLKGQLHLHSNRSGDSDTPPGEVVDWYRSRGYDFIVFTDHNRITDTEDAPGMLTLPGVELTQNSRSCDPPPAPGHACLLHIDALFVNAPPSDALLSWPEPAPTRRVDLYGRAVATTLELGGLAQINHPNFHYGADLEVVLETARRGAVLIEIANMAVDSQNEGDDRHPSTEALWDAALSRGAKLFATATDDAHHYGDAQRARERGETAYVGDLGWVMVRASKDAQSIRAAVARGDFYASTGLTLSRVELGPESIVVELADAPPGTVLEVIGEGGRVLSSVQGSRIAFAPRTATGRYLRVRAAAPDARRAWTQPLWLATSGGR
jgi:hypothetical protein